MKVLLCALVVWLACVQLGCASAIADDAVFAEGISPEHSAIVQRFFQQMEDPQDVDVDALLSDIQDRVFADNANISQIENVGGSVPKDTTVTTQMWSVCSEERQAMNSEAKKASGSKKAAVSGIVGATTAVAAKLSAPTVVPWAMSVFGTKVLGVGTMHAGLAHGGLAASMQFLGTCSVLGIAGTGAAVGLGAYGAYKAGSFGVSKYRQWESARAKNGSLGSQL